MQSKRWCDKSNKLWASLIYNIGGVSGGGSIDIKNLDFSNETVNDTQKKIVAVATNSAKYGISTRSGYCQAWVADIYQAVNRFKRFCSLCLMCCRYVGSIKRLFSNSCRCNRLRIFKQSIRSCRYLYRQRYDLSQYR